MVADALPREKTFFGIKTRPRAWFQSISIGMSGACVANNFSIVLGGEW